MPDAAAFFGPDLWLAEEMRRRGGQLGKVVVDVPDAVRLMYRVRDQLVEVVDSRHLHIALVAEVVALAVLQRQHGLFVVQMDQVLHVVFLGPRSLFAEEGAAEDTAPHIVVVGHGALRLLRRLGARTTVEYRASDRSPSAL